ncbi:hypothetical protein H6F96_10035 [Microcoleus sp. FACHB-53]|nr:hypothetical protein [Microcoleus sp. FACHB-53]
MLTQTQQRNAIAFPAVSASNPQLAEYPQVPPPPTLRRLVLPAVERVFGVRCQRWD